MNVAQQFVQIPLQGRLAIVAACGAAIGALVNLAVYRLAWEPRSISPWSAPPPGALPRRWLDRVPLVGWLGLRRESPIHGRGFWVRPLVVELLCAGGFAGLYVWEAVHLALVNMPALPIVPTGAHVSDNIVSIVHAQFLSHVFLIALMLAASLIDMDEKTIPDGITVPGTLAAMLLATVYPWSLPTDQVFAPLGGGAPSIVFLHIASPNDWPADLNGHPLRASLGVALGCWLLWCFALLPRKWNARRGWKLAVRVLVHRLRKDAATPWLALLFAVGGGAISLAWWRAEPAAWAALASSLVGLAAAGGITWAVRVLAFAVLRREAMGFGDVTLMAMIGAFLGWQAGLLVFLFAPAAGLVVACLQFVFKREDEIYYGPFLCLAALGVIVSWGQLWPEAAERFAAGWLVPAVVVVGLVLLPVLLLPVRWLMARLRGE